MDPARFLGLLQFADSGFPTGGYAHSFGLEAYCQAGLVRDRRGLLAFLRAHLEGTVGPCDATAALAVRDALAVSDVDECRRLDGVLDAMKPVREFRDASRQMGHQILRVTAELTGHPLIGAYLEEVEDGARPGHHPIAFGMTAGALGWQRSETAGALLYSSAALLVGAALRLLPIGQLEGQRVLWQLRPLLTRLACEAEARGAADLWSFAPGIELQGMRHACLETRLFRS
jgi:urease accessory protein